MTQKQNENENNLSYQKAYYQKNKDKITKQKRECRAKKLDEYNATARKRYQDKHEIILLQSARRRERFPEKTLLALAKARAKRKGIPFDITVDDIHIPDNCPLLGVPMFRSIGSIGRNSPTIDRIIPELGYTKGNIWVISSRANLIKNDSTLEELELLVLNLRKNKNNKCKSTQ